MNCSRSVLQLRSKIGRVSKSTCFRLSRNKSPFPHGYVFARRDRCRPCLFYFVLSIYQLVDDGILGRGSRRIWCGNRSFILSMVAMTEVVSDLAESGHRSILIFKFPYRRGAYCRKLAVRRSQDHEAKLLDLLICRHRTRRTTSSKFWNSR